MTKVVKVVPETVESPLLWRTWFDAGMRTLEREEFPAAVSWLCEALEHFCSSGKREAVHALTEANLSYAHYQLSKHYDDCAKDCCLSETSRESYCRLAIEERAAAEKHATCALPRLKARDDSDIAIRVGRARACFVHADALNRRQQYAEAAECYDAAYKLVKGLVSESELAQKALLGRFNVAHQSGDYAVALATVGSLRELVSDQSQKRVLLTWLIACEADLLWRTGRYGEADALFPKWKRLLSSLDLEAQSSTQAAYGAAVFGRTRLTTGHYEDAAEYLEKGLCLGKSLTESERLQSIDVRIAQAELAERCGDFPCSHELIGKAEASIAQVAAQFGELLAERKVRLCVVKARRLLALGQLEPARECFAAALEVAERDCRRKYYLVVPALLGLARIQSERSDVTCAREYIQRAFCCLEQARAWGTAEMARAFHELAYCYVQDAKPAEAEPACESALRLLRLSLRAQHPDEADIRLVLAQSLSSQHEAKRALEVVCEATAAYRRDCPCHVFHTARAMRVEAEIRHTRRDYDCAMSLLICAHRLWQDYETQQNTKHPERSLIILDLVLLNVGRGESSELIDVILKTEKFSQLIQKYKGSKSCVSVELHRRSRQFFQHGLCPEAKWLYEFSEKSFGGRNDSLAKAFTSAVPIDCPCVPWYQGCTTIRAGPCACIPVYSD